MRWFAGMLSLTATVLVISACKSPAPPLPPAPVFDTTRTIKEVMKSMVEPAADTLWNSVATNVTTTGTEVKAPTERQGLGQRPARSDRLDRGDEPDHHAGTAHGAAWHQVGQSRVRAGA